MIAEHDLIHPLIDELHEGARARGWRPDDLLDLARAMAARDGLPPARLVGPLTTRFRGANGISIAAVRTFAAEALERARRRAGAIAAATGLRPARRKARTSPGIAGERAAAPAITEESLAAALAAHFDTWLPAGAAAARDWRQDAEIVLALVRAHAPGGSKGQTPPARADEIELLREAVSCGVPPDALMNPMMGQPYKGLYDWWHERWAPVLARIRDHLEAIDHGRPGPSSGRG